MALGAPKLFISYSWSSIEHQQWVLELATNLREDGIDVILDQWDLKPGYDAFGFMEQMVNDPEIKKVIIVCDRTYAEKANNRSGGVGTETQIISPEIYQNQEQDKFVAVVAEKDDDGKAYVPTYYKSRIYIDLSNDDSYTQEYEKLIRWAYDKPLQEKPDLGKEPAYLSAANRIQLGTSIKYRRALDAIKNDKNNAKAILDEYFQVVEESFEKFRIIDSNDIFDDKVIESIDQFLPYKNELMDIFLSIAQYRNTPESWQQIHKFFEELIPYMYRTENMRKWSDMDFDNFKFIIYELFLCAISIFLKYESFGAIKYLTSQSYYVERTDSSNKPQLKSFNIFSSYIKSFEIRASRLKLNRYSFKTDILKHRSETSDIKFKLLMQSDFILYIIDCFHELNNDNNSYHNWFPETVVYGQLDNTTLKIFVQAQSKEYFDRMKEIFSIETKEDFSPLLKAFKEGKFQLPRNPFFSLDPEAIIGYKDLATKT